MTLNLFAVAWHPGAARAIAPVVVEAERRGWRSVLATSAPSSAIAKRAGVRNHQVLRYAEEAAAEVRTMPRDTVVLAGVSEGDGAEKHAIAAARNAGVATCAVLDTWGAYRERLTGTMGAAVLPDVLAVMNDEARRGIADSGFFDGSLRVTGHPGLDEFTFASATSKRAGARAALGIEPAAEVIVFASQPIRQQFEVQLGYDQYDALSMIAAAIPPQSMLLVALHPREHIDEWTSHLPPNARFVQDYDPASLYAAADIVASCFSAALTEAVLAGRPAISIQPRAADRDELWTNACGATLAAYDERQLLAALKTARVMTPAERDERRESLGIPRGATLRVMQLVEELAEKRCSRLS